MITDALENQTEFTYNSMGRVKTEKNARGAVTSYAYTSTGAMIFFALVLLLTTAPVIMVLVPVGMLVFSSKMGCMGEALDGKVGRKSFGFWKTN